MYKVRQKSDTPIVFEFPLLINAIFAILFSHVLFELYNVVLRLPM